jgi:hypothetical protein
MALPGLVAAKNLADVADRERAWDNLGLNVSANLSLEKLDGFIGAPLGGGFFAGYISHTADGNPTHALIVAPSASGATGDGYTLNTNLQWKIADTTTANTTSLFDGAANTAAIVAAGINDHPAANFCVNLTIGGFSDWYLPAWKELEIAYFNLKPTTSANGTAATTNNIYAVPRRDTAYTESFPGRTNVTAFQSGGLEAFQIGIGTTQTSGHATSTERSVNTAWRARFIDGNPGSGTLKTGLSLVRAFRRIAL